MEKPALLPARSGTLRFIVAVATLCCLVGCRDKAEPGFKECQQLHAQGELAKALAACQKAVSADPDTKAGKGAAKEVAELKVAIKNDELEQARQDTEDQLTKIKKDYDSAHRDVTDLQRQLDSTTDEATRKEIQTKLDAAKAREAKVLKALGPTGKSPSGKPHKCPPGDPMCGSL